MDFTTGAFALVVLILSIIIHEVAHGYAARWLGDPTAKLAGRLTLNPLPHIDLVGSIIVPAVLLFTGSGVLFGWAKPVPYNPYNLKNQRWGEALVGIAGVATNLLLALVFAVVTRAAYMQGNFEFATLASLVVLINLSLGLFNLIPIPPIDGFTVLRTLLPEPLSGALRDLEDRFQAGGFITLVLVLFFISQFLSRPFYELVSYCFQLLVGA